MKLTEKAFYKMALHSLRASVRFQGKKQTYEKVKDYKPQNKDLFAAWEKAFQEVLGGNNGK
jgi:hypothetical protein